MIFEDQVFVEMYVVCLFGIEKNINLRDFNFLDMDKFVCIKGLVICIMFVIFDMKDVFFKCSVCGYFVIVELDCGKIWELIECFCNCCKFKNLMQIIYNCCIFMDK